MQSKLNTLKKRLDAIAKEQNIKEFPHQVWFKNDENSLWEYTYFEDGKTQYLYKTDDEAKLIEDRPNTILISISDA